jgi:hypothetical protein
MGDATVEAAHEAAKAAHYAAVFGHDAKKDRDGNYIQQGIGAPGRENANHFAAIRRYQGEAAFAKAVKEIWGRNPGRAKKLGLPQPERN